MNATQKDRLFLAAMCIEADGSTDALTYHAELTKATYQRMRELEVDRAHEDDVDEDDAPVVAVKDVELTVSLPISDAELVAFYQRINDMLTSGVREFRVRVQR